MSNRKPPIFVVSSAEASRDGAGIALELTTEAQIAMIFTMNPQKALELAHDIERAFHQRELTAGS